MLRIYPRPYCVSNFIAQDLTDDASLISAWSARLDDKAASRVYTGKNKDGTTIYLDLDEIVVLLSVDKSRSPVE